MSLRWLLIVVIALMIYFMTSQAPAHAQVESSPWTGTLETHWRGGGAILRLEQSGTRVTGTYPLYEGSVEGTVEGQKLRGHWSRIGGRGEFIFVLSPDGNSFMGRFDYGEWWTGTRLADEMDYKVETSVLTSPRATLRSFLKAGNAAREGFVESIRP
ncbi:MAG: hypothetical protein JRF56_00630, partial [Deltaproteobacteria bacterium]|nr:hypothetical protein [Deltaproteobacteria bacterium]